MISEVKFGVICNTQEIETLYCFDFLIVHTNCMCRIVIILTVANVRSLIFFKVSSNKIVIIPLSSSARTVP